MKAFGAALDELVLTKICRQLDHTLLLEPTREGIARTRAETSWMTHLGVILR